MPNTIIGASSDAVSGTPTSIGLLIGIASAHDRVDLKHDISAADLEPDSAARSSFRDAWLGMDGSVRPLAHYGVHRVEGAGAVFAFERGGAALQKEICVRGSRLSVGYRYTGAFGAVCDGPGAHDRSRDVDIGGLGQPLSLEGMTELVLVDNFMGASLTLRSNLPVALQARPCYTVSQSEGGFEKIMQSVTLTLAWPLSPAHASVDLSLEIRKHSA